MTDKLTAEEIFSLIDEHSYHHKSTVKYWVKQAQLAKVDKPVCPDCMGEKTKLVKRPNGRETRIDYRCPTCQGEVSSPDREKIEEYVSDAIIEAKREGKYYISPDATIINKILALFDPDQIRKQESLAVIRCIKDALRVHPDWNITDVIELLNFREETRQALKQEKPTLESEFASGKHHQITSFNYKGEENENI